MSATVSSKGKDAFFIVGMVLAWSAYYLASDWGVEFTGSAFTAGMLLRAAAFVFLTLYIAVKGKIKDLFRQGKTTVVLLVIGVLGFLLDTFANLGFQHGSVGTGTVLLKTDILMANVASAVFFREKLRLSDWFATFVMLAGVILVLDIDFQSVTFNWYDLFFIASALSVTVNAFVIKGAQDKLQADSDVIAYYNNFVVMVLFTVSALISGDCRMLGGASFGAAEIFIIIGGGLAQSLIYVFYYRNLKRHPVWVVKLYMLFVPVISCIVGAAAFNESFSALKGAGIALVLVGAAIIVAREKLAKNKNVSKVWTKYVYTRDTYKGGNIDDIEG